MKVNIGDIFRVKPSKALVKIRMVQMSLTNLAWLKNYWKTKYDIKLPKFFDILEVKFPNSDKIYQYPRYRKCIKRLLRQKKFLNLFKEQEKPKIAKGSNFLRQLKEDYNRYLEDKNNDF